MPSRRCSAFLLAASSGALLHPAAAFARTLVTTTSSNPSSVRAELRANRRRIRGSGRYQRAREGRSRMQKGATRGGEEEGGAATGRHEKAPERRCFKRN